MNLLADKKPIYKDTFSTYNEASNVFDKNYLCSEYTNWFNSQNFSDDTKNPPECDSDDWDSPGEKIEKIGDFLKSQAGEKWVLSCCWNSENLTSNMQLGLCTKTDFNHDGKFIPSTTCDAYMTEYCSNTRNNIQQSICGCFRTDISNNKFDEALFRELQKTNPELQPKCVMNRCYNPSAYRTRDMQKADCPNVCSVISSDPNSQTYVAVNCSTNDIIVNKIPDIIRNTKGSSLAYQSYGDEKPYYKTTTFYVLLAAIIILLILLVGKMWKRKRV